MNPNELAYIGNFDPYEQEEFEKRIVRVVDAITGVQITSPTQVTTDAELIAHLITSIRASYDKQVLVIYVEKERNDSRWNA
jgi:hypothetical protein